MSFVLDSFCLIAVFGRWPISLVITALLCIIFFSFPFFFPFAHVQLLCVDFEQMSKSQKNNLREPEYLLQKRIYLSHIS
jgi:hypothetical protein